MAFQTKIQALVNAHTNTSFASTQTAIDWVNSWFYQNGPGTGSFPSHAFLTKIDLLSGLELAFEDLTSYSPNAYDGQPIAVDATGVYLDVPSFNLLKADKNSLAQVLNTSIAFAVSNGTMSPIRNTSGVDWLLLTAIGETSTLEEVYQCNRADDFSLWTPGTLNYNAFTALSCSGLFGAGIGYLIAAANNSDSGFQLIKVNVNVGTEGATVVASHPPSAVDTAFTALVCVGVCLDQTDGNVLAMFTGTPSGANPSYLLKVNSTTGAIIWNLGLPMDATFPQGQMQQSVIKSQQLILVFSPGGGVNHGLVIDTNAGTLTTTITTGLTGIGPAGDQCFNDQTGAIIQEYDFTQNAAGPILLNSTPTAFKGWGALYIVPGMAGGGSNPNGGTTRAINSTVAANQAFLQAINAIAGENNCGDEYPSEIQYLTAFEEAQRWRAGRQ